MMVLWSSAYSDWEMFQVSLGLLAKILEPSGIDVIFQQLVTGST